MMADRQSRRARWRALLAALALLVGAVSAPLALAGSSTGEACTMACCVEQGHCCCKPRHTSVEGQAADPTPRINGNEVAAPCPADCAGSSAPSPYVPRQALDSAGPWMDESLVPALPSLFPVSRSLVAIKETTAPRAPPARFLPFAS